jgi:hypothetical protein
VTERKEQVSNTLQKINPGQVGMDSAGNADVVLCEFQAVITMSKYIVDLKLSICLMYR